MDHYAQYLSTMQGKLHQQLFTTDASGLWELYLRLLPESERQHHNCRACRHFIERYGGLVAIENGNQVSIWNPGKGIYKKAFAALNDVTERSSVTGVFLSDVAQLGTPMNFDDFGNKFSHFACGVVVRGNAVATCDQQMAAKKEDHKNVCAALFAFRKQTLEAAVSILRSDLLYRSEKVLGAAEWLLEYYNSGATHRWSMIADAPAGFCHPRSSMIGTLLEDLESGMAIETVRARFQEKMDPLKYQRPTAMAPTGAIAAAEKLVAKMGIERSLERRFCRPDEVQAFWKPKQVAGVFGHLVKQNAMRVTQPITWEKFNRDVLPVAQRLELMLTASAMPFCGLLTAVHADAPPIIQWDDATRRNPVSWYCYAHGTTPSQFALQAGYAEVSMLTCKPSTWNLDEDAMRSHHGAGVIFILKNAKDKNIPQLALFPEILRTELHSVRSVIEAHNNSKEVSENSQNSQACGIMFAKGSQNAVTLKVHTAAYAAVYKIDRWD